MTSHTNVAVALSLLCFVASAQDFADEHEHGSMMRGNTQDGFPHHSRHGSMMRGNTQDGFPQDPYQPTNVLEMRGNTQDGFPQDPYQSTNELEMRGNTQDGFPQDPYQSTNELEDSVIQFPQYDVRDAQNYPQEKRRLSPYFHRPSPGYDPVVPQLLPQMYHGGKIDDQPKPHSDIVAQRCHAETDPCGKSHPLNDPMISFCLCAELGHFWVHHDGLHKHEACDRTLLDSCSSNCRCLPKSPSELLMNDVFEGVGEIGKVLNQSKPSFEPKKKRVLTPEERKIVDDLQKVYENANPKFYLGEEGATGCGSDRVATQDECANAAESLRPAETDRPERGMQVESWGYAPPGCSVESRGDWAAHFNKPVNSNPGTWVYTNGVDKSDGHVRNTDMTAEQRNNGHFTPVCKSSPHTQESNDSVQNVEQEGKDVEGGDSPEVQLRPVVQVPPEA